MNGVSDSHTELRACATAPSFPPGMNTWEGDPVKLKPALAMLAAMVMAPGLAAADEKADKCEAAPTHACVLDLMWDAMPRVTDNFQAETKRAFIDAALLTGDKVLIDL